MSDTTKVGQPVIDQAADNSLANTEPALLTGAIVGIVGAVCSIGVISGWIDQNVADEIKNQAGILVPSFLIIAGLLTGALTGLRAYSPRTAARIAVENAPANVPPTLVTPP